MIAPHAVRRTLLAAGIAAVALAGGCAALSPQPEQKTWTAVSHGVSFDPATGGFKRQGIALFPNGERALVTTEGRFTARDGSTFTARLVYRFDDGSSFVHEGIGKFLTRGATATAEGTGKFVDGTGRFAGIAGDTASTSRNLSENDQVTEFRSAYTLPAR